MKKGAFLLLLPLCFLFTACSSPDAESGSLDTSAVSLLAQQRFEEVFQEADGLEIQGKSVYAQNAEPDHVVIVFHYSAGGKSGDYGLEYQGNPEDGFQLLQEGAEVTGALLEASSALPAKN